MRNLPHQTFLALAVISLWFSNRALSTTAAEVGTELFETTIRPVLTAECYQCHGAVRQKAGLRLDYRDGLLTGGDSGPVLDLGNPSNSLLLRVLRHEIPDLEMPEDGAPLTTEVIDSFEKWISDGAPDPRVKRPEPEAAAEVESSTWDAAMEFRKSWWSFQPVRRPPIPRSSENPDWAWTSIDGFLQSRWESEGLQPSGDAPLRLVCRRIHLVLTGLPPEPGDIEKFVAAGSVSRRTAIENEVDRLLQSEHFGEKWARHWMDWVRYAESHGSEGDPAIPYAWRYRDYLIRALNQDVPYDQLVTEHIAGDLLESPRVDGSAGINESRIGPAHLRMVLHGFAPTDALDELVRFTENQIDVTFKAFQSLTVTCARCHNHKFDPISQEDFYGVFGVMATTRPASISIDTDAVAHAAIRELDDLKGRIKSELIRTWRSEIEYFRSHADELADRLTSAAAGAEDMAHPLMVWKQLTAIENRDERASAWTAMLQSFKESADRLLKRTGTDRKNLSPSWNFASVPEDGRQWYAHGNAVSTNLPPHGSFSVATEGNGIINGIYPAGFYSHLYSTRHRAVVESPDFVVEEGDLYLRVAGDGNASARYVIQNYPRNGTVYPVTSINNSPDWRWIRFNLDYWSGDDAHIEVATAADQPVLARTGQERSWFGLTDAVVVPRGQTPPQNEPAEFISPLIAAIESSPESHSSDRGLAASYLNAIGSAIRRWESGQMSAPDSRFLDAVVRSGLLRNTTEPESALAGLVDSYRRVEAEKVMVPRRAPGVHEGPPRIQKLMVRGNHKDLGNPVPRKFLDVFGGREFTSTNSGRIELAEAIMDRDNTLTSRVIVNRLWHHVFGRGIVPTVDNFGRLGEKPSHPELLDHLASEMVTNNWSIKSMLRQILVSRTFQLSPSPQPGTSEIDPTDILLSHFPVRRLEAETIRDSMLAVSRSLDRTLHGPSAGEKAGRRSLYLPVIRNNLNDFLTTFDFPAPVSTLGQRNDTNVPAQSLMMMNDPFVLETAAKLAEEARQSGASSTQRIIGLFRTVLGRAPDSREIEMGTAFLDRAEATTREARVEIETLNRQLEKTQEQVRVILNEGRTRAIGKRSSGQRPPDDSDVLMNPIASWDFTSGGPIADLTLHGDARLTSTGLVLNGGYARSSSLEFPGGSLSARTLSVRAIPADVRQRGGGLLTIENNAGDRFDSIVLGERQTGHWIAGSEFFNRTSDVGGKPEPQPTGNTPVHIAITYDESGNISIYRNGEPYGAPYQTSGVLKLESRASHVLLGLRHLPDSPGKRFHGVVLEAAVHDRALSQEEVRALAENNTGYVPREELVQTLTETERNRLMHLEDAVQSINGQLAALNQHAAAANDPLIGIAQSLLNMKEFIYLF
jgi:hypothetical protein